MQTSYWYGLPRDVTFPGATMDISFMYTQVADKANVQADATNFLRAVGPRTSALEHLVPEQLFSTDENPAEGVSAVKLMALAQTEGQRVYSITASNLESALATVNADSAIENEIRNAVHTGKEVSIHQNAINHYGWSGHGYIIIDPETGSGAYKISGGANGGDCPLPESVGTLLSVVASLSEKFSDGLTKIFAKLTNYYLRRRMWSTCFLRARRMSCITRYLFMRGLML